MIEVIAVHVPRAVAALGRARFKDVLDPAKRERVLRITRDEDRDRGAVADALWRLAVARRLGERAPPAGFAADRWGKLFLPDAPWLHFSVAHAGVWAVCATGLAPLGVDVECLQAISEESWAHLLSAEEARDAHRFTGEDRRWLVCGLWTVKESFVNAIGVGWLTPPESLTVRKDGDGAFRLVGHRDAAQYKFRLYPLDGDHLVALCASAGKFPEAVERVEPAALSEMIAKTPTVWAPRHEGRSGERQAEKVGPRRPTAGRARGTDR